MTLDPGDVTAGADFDEVARRLAAGADLTVVEPRYAGLWGDPARYPTAVTLVAMPSAGGIGVLIVPLLRRHRLPLPRERARGIPVRADLLGWATTRPVDHHDWRPCPMIPYEDPLFVRAARLLWDRYHVRTLTVLIEGSGYEPWIRPGSSRSASTPVGAAGGTIRFYRVADRYGSFSNFAPYLVRLDRVKWPTTEHYFQAQMPILARFPAGRARLAAIRPRLEERALREQVEAALAAPEPGTRP
jgi:hypothetical protein